ncbi:hypothetical protein [Bacteriovorax sp. Seq25_V]|uniref:hypothetical protein n=1 Tax=Bacteriovorax sp. Seq25_V TaxID=1201288 RepID=UPI00038A2516|nr:hypothetical protein [Bacteriovorax sp. Seq25_V]EQC46659.1 hypothetical protein M900_2369 [Bacteriovorax sp. Seq25_V]
MNKKITSVLVIILIIGSIIYLQKNKDNKEIVEQPSKEEKIETTKKLAEPDLTPAPNKSDITSLKASIKKEMSESVYFDEVIDFSKSEEEFFAKQAPTSIYSNAKELIKQITDCLTDFCSMSADKDGYFDPKNTVADKVLARNLKLLYLVSTESNIFDYNIDDLDFETIFKSQNNFVQENALKLYLNRYQEQADIVKLFNFSNNIQEEVKGTFYAMLDEVTKQDPYLRDTFLSSLNSELKNASGYTKIEIIEKIEYLDIDKEEAKKAFDSICSEKSDKIINAFNVNLKKNKGASITYKTICN